MHDIRSWAHVHVHAWRHTDAYPAFVSECATSGGVADAFLPITTLGLADWQGCDVFGVRYPIIVQNIARFLGNLRMGTQYFEGHVIFVTSPPHTPGCDGVSAPNEGGTVPADVVWASQYVTKPEHYYQQVQYAETVWRSAFQKWACVRSAPEPSSAPRSPGVTLWPVGSDGRCSVRVAHAQRAFSRSRIHDPLDPVCAHQ